MALRTSYISLRCLPMMPQRLETTMRLTPNGLPACSTIIAFLACAPSAVSADVICPMKIGTLQGLTMGAAGWTVGVDSLPTELAGISVFDGPPDQQAHLVPDNGAETGDTRSDIWTLPKNERGYWLTCRYSSTTVTLTRQLPATVTRCEAAYEKQQSFIG